MNYELAKQLWDAGYPFKERDKEIQLMCLCTEDICNGPLGRMFRFEGSLYSEPSLSELIEACGYGFRSLSLHTKHTGQVGDNHRWIAKAGAISAGGKSFLVNGHTAEEAVAKLWLKLNKK